ncbi:hypothetical protein KOW79_015149 [Hemibagrus wyckioides]|uniref:Uncharacterized protein n=1 Tax=Hemibagrus wyckioides TaxID=337641 RepID=A0A9D3SIV5_9TELE|nr:hypothetical protein KOW79_015149 [Hemibagrus wyckioides]
MGLGLGMAGQVRIASRREATRSEIGSEVGGIPASISETVVLVRASILSHGPRNRDRRADGVDWDQSVSSA